MTRLKAALLAALLASLAACRDQLTVIEYGEPVPIVRVVGTAGTKTQFSTVLALLNRPENSDIVNRLNNTRNLLDIFDFNRVEEQFTLFLPNNKAFESLSEADRKALLADNQRIRRLLLYHASFGTYTLEQLPSRRRLPSLYENRPLHFSVENGRVKVNEATVVEGDFKATNGVVHEIDRLLTPDSYVPPESPIVPTPPPN